mgnify:CR=1 FL=1
MQNLTQKSVDNHPIKAPSTRIKAGGGKTDIRQEITDEIIEMLESGDVDFNLGFDFTDGLPVNASTGVNYTGVNIFKLSMEKKKMGYLRNKWLTFKQAQEMGGFVRKGECGVRAVKYGRYEDKKQGSGQKLLGNNFGSSTDLLVIGDDDAKSNSRTFINSFVLFNVAQIDGIEWNFAENKVIEVDVIDSLIRSLNIRLECNEKAPFFSVAHDYISMPPRAFFETTEFYYASLLHEVAHWTGHKSRLDRNFDKRFETNAYAFEELVAELGAAMLGGLFGIYKPIAKNHAGYIAHWIEILKGDKGAFITAASKAWEATDFIQSELLKIIDTNSVLFLD